ncbi:sensor histidine kinase [Sphingomonas oleivorans]|uniref:sensor histidine kinase n=1 Tax=Sphingomonas oleivorans TaxID=1735121 RepID=UPI0013FDED63|nr:ATP-binding protein [Sphingomonas oleivorans]
MRLEALGMMTAGIVHDLGNDVQLLSAAIHRLKARSSLAASAELQPVFEGAEASLRRISGLVRAILGFARAPATVEEPVDLSACFAELEQLLHWVVDANVVLTTRVDDDLPLVRCNRQKLENALLNLVLNANEAIPDDGLIAVVVMAEGNQLMVEVADSGIGMTPEVETRAFDPFFTTKSAGTGLGLAMVRHFAEEARGSVSISTGPGSGTRVRLFLPALPSGAGARQAADDWLDQALVDSFPASDPIAF